MPGIRRVASMPSSPGMRMSMRTTWGPVGLCQCDGFATVRGFADDGDVVLCGKDDGREPLSHEGLVVSDQDADHSVVVCSWA